VFIRLTKETTIRSIRARAEDYLADLALGFTACKTTTTANCDLSVVLADAGHGDRLLCQVTRKPYAGAHAIELDQSAFVSGSLLVTR
jgi:hypothetical protein